MNHDTNRNGEIDLLRFLFALFIMFLHFGYRPYVTLGGFTLKLGQNGGFAVTFFFVLSGYLLSKKVEKMSLGEEDSNKVDLKKLADETGSFMWKKYRYYMRWYLPAFFLCALLEVFKCGIIPVLVNCVYSIPNLLLLGALGFSSDAQSIGFYVGASWFISTLFCVQFILFPAMKFNYSMWSKEIAPIAFMICTVTNLSGKGFIFSDAIQAMILGGFCYEAVKRISYIRFKDWFCVLMRIMESVIFLGCFLYMCIDPPAHSDIIMMFIVAIGIVLAFLPQCSVGVFNSSIFTTLGKISFPLYLLHIQVLKWGEYLNDIFFHINNDVVKYLCLYVIALLIAAVSYLVSQKYDLAGKVVSLICERKHVDR